MVTQILNFGLPAPIDIQVIGNNLQGNREFIDRLLKDISYVPGTADLHIQQPFNNPHFLVDVNRSKAQDIGLTQRDVAGSLLVATSGSFQTSPTYWLDPKKRCQLQHRRPDPAIYSAVPRRSGKHPSDHDQRGDHHQLPARTFR